MKLYRIKWEKYEESYIEMIWTSKHVKRRCTEAVVRRCENVTITGSNKGRDRSNKNWGDVIKHDKTHYLLER